MYHITHLQAHSNLKYIPNFTLLVPSHIGIPRNLESRQDTLYEATSSPLSIKMNTSSSFETFNIIHNKIMEDILRKSTRLEQIEKC